LKHAKYVSPSSFANQSVSKHSGQLKGTFLASAACLRAEEAAEVAVKTEGSVKAEAAVETAAAVKTEVADETEAAVKTEVAVETEAAVKTEVAVQPCKAKRIWSTFFPVGSMPRFCANVMSASFFILPKPLSPMPAFGAGRKEGS
jgi:hypothetical protein